MAHSDETAAAPSPADVERVSPTRNARTPTTSAPPAAPSAPTGVRKLTLEEAVNLALAQNRSLADVRAGSLSAEYSVAAAGAEFRLRIFPRLRANLAGGSGGSTSDNYGIGVDFQQRFAYGTDVSLEPSVDRNDETFTSGVNLSIRQPLIRGSDPVFVRSAVAGAEFGARSARRGLYLAQVSTIVSIVGAVYQAVRQREFYTLTEVSAERTRGYAEAARAKERAGLATSIDVYRATLQLNQAQDDLSAARRSYEDALDAVRFLTALPIDQELEISAPLTFDPLRIDEEAAVALALEQRVELLQAEDVLAESRRRSAVARHGTKRDLDLLVSYSQFGIADSFGDSTGFGDDTFSVSLVTTSDLARIAEKAFYEQSKLQVDVARRGLDSQRDLITREVKRERRNLERLERRLALQDDRIAQAEGKAAVAKLKFNRGFATNFNVIEAESELREAQTNAISATIDYIIGTYSFRAALGSLLTRPPGLQ